MTPPSDAFGGRVGIADPPGHESSRRHFDLLPGLNVPPNFGGCRFTRHVVRDEVGLGPGFAYPERKFIAQGRIPAYKRRVPFYERNSLRAGGIEQERALGTVGGGYLSPLPSLNPERFKR